eukprot:80393_1
MERLEDIKKLWEWIDEYYKTNTDTNDKNYQRFQNRKQKKYDKHTAFMANKNKTMHDIETYFKSLCQWIEMKSRDNSAPVPSCYEPPRKKRRIARANNMCSDDIVDDNNNDIIPMEPNDITQSSE